MGVVITIVLGVVVGLITAEIIANGQRIAKWLIAGAVPRIPEHDRERFREEWLAHLDELPGFIGKLRHALGCNWKGVAVALRNRPRRIQASADMTASSNLVVDAIGKGRSSPPHHLEALPLITSSPWFGTPTLEQHRRVISPALWESFSSWVPRPPEPPSEEHPPPDETDQD